MISLGFLRHPVTEMVVGTAYWAGATGMVFMVKHAMKTPQDSIFPILFGLAGIAIFLDGYQRCRGHHYEQIHRENIPFTQLVVG